MSKPTYGEMRSRSERIEDAALKERVQAGLARLQDGFGEGWEEEINCATLEMSDGSACVLGQVYGDYDSGRDELGIRSGAPYGFDVFNGPIGNQWVELNEAWNAILCDKEAIPTRLGS